MKKLIWLMILGVIFFIGGQWLGLNFSEKNRENPPPAILKPGASGAQEGSGGGSGADH